MPETEERSCHWSSLKVSSLGQLRILYVPSIVKFGKARDSCINSWAFLLRVRDIFAVDDR